ncbi:MAG: glycosyltransferase family 4 protein, partial [Gemmataceae bacterium]
IITHANWPHAIFGPVAVGLRRPVWNWVHDRLKGTSWVERWAARTRPRGVIANSHFSAQFVREVFPGSPLAVIYCPTVPPRVATSRAMVRAEFGTTTETVVILQASRLERWKGAAVLLQAVQQLPATPAWECWLAGGVQRPEEETYWAELQTLARQSAGRVRLLGQRSDVAALLHAADIYCQPNTGPEPFGLSFVEALSAGRPVVGSRLGATPELIDATCGILVEPGDVPGVTTALRSLIEQPAQREQLSAAAPARAAQLCDPTECLRQLGQLLETSL